MPGDRRLGGGSFKPTDAYVGFALPSAPQLGQVTWVPPITGTNP